MPRSRSHNTVVVEWWIEDGVLKTYVVDSLPKDGSGAQVKIPGGGSKQGESMVATGRREFEEEVGRQIKEGVVPTEVHREKVGGHLKVALLVHSSECEGELRMEPLEEKDSLLMPPRAVILQQAIHEVLCHQGNTFHRDALIGANDVIASLLARCHYAA